MKKLLIAGSLLACSLSTVTFAEQSETGLLGIQQQWAHINYEVEKDDDKVSAFLALIEEAEARVKAEPDNADNYIWLGIVQSSTAGAKGGLGALKFADAAKENLEHAIKLDENALQGSAMTSLGVLYHKVPGWPISFGSDKKAAKLLSQALKVNPDGIDPNYFYAEYLYDEGDYKEAKMHLDKALAAAPRVNRPLADSGRKEDINALMAKVNKKL